jgi:hypothetical protein
MGEADFARAFGNIPDHSATQTTAKLARWGEFTDSHSAVAGPVAMGVSVAPGGSSAAIAIAGRRPDRLLHGEVTGRHGIPDHRPGTAWLVDRACEIAAAQDVCVLVLNPAGAAGAFEKTFIERGFAVKPGPGQRRLMLTGTREYAQACGGLAADVDNEGWRHLGQPSLDDAVDGAGTRPLAGAWAWAWERSQNDIAPLDAVTLARHGFMTYGTSAAAKPFAIWG